MGTRRECRGCESAVVVGVGGIERAGEESTEDLGRFEEMIAVFCVCGNYRVSG